MLSVFFSSGFDCPKLKPPLEELLSVLDEPVPKTIPPLVPNLNPELAAGRSDFLSSVEAVPNLKPSDELPNLNPDVVVSLEVVSDEELPKEPPNLIPPDVEEDDSVKEPPNLKPPDSDPDVLLSEVPNLKPPEAVEPNVDELVVPGADEPKIALKALGSTLAPGLVA